MAYGIAWGRVHFYGHSMDRLGGNESFFRVIHLSDCLFSDGYSVSNVSTGGVLTEQLNYK